MTAPALERARSHPSVRAWSHKPAHTQLDRPPRRKRRLELLMWLGILAAARLGCLLALNQFMAGAEATDDVLHHYSMMRDPLQILLATSVENEQFPPLLPLVEAAFALPFMGSFEPGVAARLAYITMELVAFAVMWPLLGAAWPGGVRRWLCAAWIVAPLTWMTNVVMAQEEMVSAIAFASICMLVLHRRLLAAILVCSLGVVAAKIFFLVPLLALVAGPRCATFRALTVRMMIAAVPVALVYLITTYFRLQAGQGLPLAGFSPPALLSVTFWSEVDLWGLAPVQTIKYASLAASLAVGLLPLVVAKIREGAEGLRLIRVATAMVLWVFLMFYCTSPEYYMLVLPGLYLTLRPSLSIAVVTCMLTLGWAINFFHGVMHASTANQAKDLFVRLYYAIFRVDPATMHAVTVAAFAVLCIALAVHVTAPLARQRSGLAEE